MPGSWPDADQLTDLVRRLRAGDPVAQGELIEAVLDPLLAHLRVKSLAADDHDRITAAEDAVLSLVRNLAQFDPARGDLPRFLKMAARGDLANLQKKERCHRQNRESADSVELVPDGRNCSEEDAGLPSLDSPALAAVIAAFTPEERQVFDLMRDGERRTAVYAAVLGLTARPPDEQARGVKQAKDRIKARLRRAGEGL